MQRIGLLFDCLRAPYDIAHIYQVAVALGNCDLYLSGNCINPNHKKIVSKTRSWGIEEIPSFRKFESLESAVSQLHDEGKYLIGTSPYTNNNIYDIDLTKHDSVIVFGTESSGLTKRKSFLLDDLIKIPMTSECKFLTLPTAVPVVAYEFYRQIRRSEK
jgi:tRNA G18 (ribose-2'-O)-methylase SpoU